jgi:glycosyltransferase involved in cell wall biosynthesis
MYSVFGGDSVQVQKTAAELRKLGVQADVYKASDVINYDRYDLLHFFNIIRPSDHLYHIRRSNKPYVVSTIYLEYSGFDRRGRGAGHRLLFGLLRESGAEYVKNLFRFFKRQDKLISAEYIWGHQRAIKSILRNASAILPNSQSECNRVVRDFGYNGKSYVVPNGIDSGIFGELPADVSREHKVICVAQVFGMKNQHLVINACKSLGVPLDIIGNPPPNHRSYYDMCRRLAGPDVKFYGFLTQEQLVRHYTSAKVHALPSWFETTGLSSLEAAALGCNLVVSALGDTADYFDGYAWFCTPDDHGSVVNAVAQALEAPSNMAMRPVVLENYTWKRAAEVTLDAYNNVLANPKPANQSDE